MSRYINWQNVVGRYPRVSELEGKSSSVGSSFIDYAEVEIEGRLTEFSKPFSSNNLTVQDLAIDLTYIKILTPANNEKAMEMRDVLDRRISMLNEGKEAMMTVDGEIVAADLSGCWGETMDVPPVFYNGPVEDMKVDSGYLYDQENDRL